MICGERLPHRPSPDRSPGICTGIESMAGSVSYDSFNPPGETIGVHHSLLVFARQVGVRERTCPRLVGGGLVFHLEVVRNQEHPVWVVGSAQPRSECWQARILDSSLRFATIGMTVAGAMCRMGMDTGRWYVDVPTHLGQVLIRVSVIWFAATSFPGMFP